MRLRHCPVLVFAFAVLWGLPAPAAAGDTPCATIDVVQNASSFTAFDAAGTSSAIQQALQAALPRATVQTALDHTQWARNEQAAEKQDLAEAQSEIAHGVSPQTAMAEMAQKQADRMSRNPPPSDGDVLVQWSVMPLGASIVLDLRAIGDDGKNYYGNFSAISASAANTAASVFAGYASAAAAAIAPNFVCMAFKEHDAKIAWPCQTSHSFEVDITDLTGADATTDETVLFFVTSPSLATVDPQAPTIRGTGQTTLTLKQAGEFILTAKMTPQHQKEMTDTAVATAAKDGKVQLTIDGVRQLDAEQLWNMKSSPLGVFITPFRELLQANGAMTFTGKGTQTDHMSGSGSLDPGGSVITFSTDWTALLNTPHGTMESPAISVSFTITPYTLRNTVELDAEVSGPNASTLQFAPNLTMLATAQGGSGSGVGTIHVPGGQPFTQTVPLKPGQQLGTFFMMTPFTMTRPSDGSPVKKFFTGSDEGGSWVYTVTICGGS